MKRRGASACRWPPLPAFSRGLVLFGITCVALSDSSRATVLVMPSHTMRDSTVLRAKLESTLRGLRCRRREHHKQFNDLNQALLSRLTGRKLISCKELHILHASIHNEL